MKKTLAALGCAVMLAASAAPALAETSTVTRADGYTVTLSGPDNGVTTTPSSYTATCGYVGQTGPCPYGEFRMFGGPLNRLGEGFGRGAFGIYSFRTTGGYIARYRVGASCLGSPRQACPIDVFVRTAVNS